MSTEQLLKIVKERGLRIEIKDGRPVLIRKAGDPALTDRLLAVLKRHRERIVTMLTPAAKQGEMFPKDGNAYG